MRWNDLRKILFDFVFETCCPGKSELLKELKERFAKGIKLKSANRPMATRPLINRRLLMELRRRKSRPLRQRMGVSNDEESKSSSEVLEHNPSFDRINSIHFSYVRVKKFVHLKEENNKVTLFFSDNSSEGNFDFVIGCDGINSNVRSFTEYGNQNWLASIPIIGRYLPNSYGSQGTGIRLAMFVAPLLNGIKNPLPSFYDTKEKVDADLNKLSEKIEKNKHSPGKKIEMMKMAMKDASTSPMKDTTIPRKEGLSAVEVGKVHQRCGNKCNAVTFAVGGPGEAHGVAFVLYRDKLHSKQSQRWRQASDKHILDDMRTMLKSSGIKDHMDILRLMEMSRYYMNNFKTMDRVVQMSSVIDVSLRDFCIPLRSWSSKSGRILITGDAAHAMAPLINQGPNQALIDAYKIGCLINCYNSSETEKMSVMQLMTEDMKQSTEHLKFGIINFFSSIMEARSQKIGFIKRMMCYFTSCLNLMFVILGLMFVLFYNFLHFIPMKSSKIKMMTSIFERSRKIQTLPLIWMSRFIITLQSMESSSIKSWCTYFLYETGMLKAMMTFATRDPIHPTRTSVRRRKSKPVIDSMQNSSPNKLRGEEKEMMKMTYYDKLMNKNEFLKEKEMEKEKMTGKKLNILKTHQPGILSQMNKSSIGVH